MALLYPWATKEYLLWKMSLGQTIMYYALGMEAKYPKPDDGKPSRLKHMTKEEILKLRDEMRELGLSPKSKEQPQQSQEMQVKKEQLKQKYGAIDG